MSKCSEEWDRVWNPGKSRTARNLVGPERLRRDGPRDSVPDVAHRLGTDAVLRAHRP
jgi:hypothetical protein